MRAALLALLAVAAVRADVTGTVINQTTGKPQPNATVTLYKLGGAGMESVESVKSGADGAFAIKQPVEGPHLVQTAFDGVTYNHMLPPGRPTTGLSLTVYDASSKRPPGVKVDTHMVLLEPGAGQVTVNESIIFRNESTVAYNDPDGGTLRIFVPEGAGGRVTVRATAPQGMPIDRAAEKTSSANVYKIDFPVKPGETRFDVTYSAPLEGGTFAGKVLHGGGPVRFVAPAGVTLKSDSLRLLGQEPTTQASVFELNGAEFKVEIEGTGSLQGVSEAGGDEEEGGAGLQQIRPSVYDRFYPVLGLAFFILLIGLLLLYRRGTPAAEAAGAAAPPAAPQAKAAGKGKRRG